MTDSIEFSEERLLNNEWMDLDAEIRRDLSAFRDPADVIKAGVDGKNACDWFMPVARQNGKKDMVMRDLLGDDEPAPNLDERVEASRKSWEAAVYACAKRDIERRFTHYSPKAEQLSTCTTIRNTGMDMALRILDLCPTSPERDKAIDAVDMAVMWANASIARHTK